MGSSPEKVDVSRWPVRACPRIYGRRKRRSAAYAARILVATGAAAVVALVLPTLAGASYGWPIKPFNQQHPVRGQLNDPRMNGPDFYSSSSHTFHFGLDIAAPDGTAVYAVAPGWVKYLSSSAIAVRSLNDVTTFAYWHIRPVAKKGKKVKLHALLGYIEPGRGHVHFAEKRNDRYVNPLRRGGLTPYIDTTPPTINSVSYYDTTYHDLTSATVSGTVKFTVNAFDTPELASNWPWAVVTPSWIGWQLFAADGTKLGAGHLDLGSAICPLNPLAVFAPGTSKNSAFGAGAYDYWLGRPWDTTRVADGAYRLVATVADERGNATSMTDWLTVANAPVAAIPVPPATSPAAG
jgi:murein DD-endopeptidase MepM/ murein hydrolase activator NlpD